MDDVVDRSGVYISLSVKVPRGVSSKVRYMNCRYKKEIGVIVVNALAHKGKNIFYSRSKTIVLPTQYNPKQITNYGISSAISYLEKEGLVINNIAPRDYGWYDHESISSSFIATDKLLGMFSVGKNVDNSKQTIVVDTQRVVLKDDDKNTVAYKECDITRYTRCSLSTYNKYISDQHITYLDKHKIVHNASCCLTRIFNVEIGNTGRLYRSEIINIRSEYRQTILINGIETVEIDYSALHLRMLIDKYLCADKIPSGVDAYMLPLTEDEQTVEANRDAVKTAFNILLNNSKRHLACSAIQQYLNLKNRDCTIRSGSVLLSKIEEAYSFLPLQVILWQSKPLAYSLQKLDSDIALEIISAGVEDNIAVLPIHDSFVVQARHKNWLQDAMGNTYRKHLRTEEKVPVTVSFAGEDYKEFA
jgi:hypothetical protein